MQFDKEKQILTTIKYAPILFIISIGFIFTAFLYYEKNLSFQNEKQKITQKYVDENKILIKNRVLSVHSYILHEQSNTEALIKTSLNEAVNNAYNIAKSIYDANPHKSKSELLSMIKNALRSIRFNEGRGYFFVYDKTGKTILQPLLPHTEGKNALNHQSSRGEYVVKDAIKLLENKEESYHTWYWKKTKEDNKEYKKIGFVKNFNELNLFIGTGEYVEDYTKNVQEHILRYIGNIKYDKKGYIFIVNYNGTVLANLHKERIGKNIFDTKGVSDIESIFEKGLELAKKGGGFLKYTHQLNSDDSKQDIVKTMYITGFEKWKWLVATGFYEDDLKEELLNKQQELDQEFLKYIEDFLILSAILIILLLILSMLISKLLEKKFNTYRNNIQESITENINQKNKLLRAQEVAHIGHWELDIKTMQAQWSHEILKIIGLKAFPKDCGPDFLKKIMVEKDWPLFHASIMGTIEDNKEHRSIYRIIRPNGEQRWLDCRGQKNTAKDKIEGVIQDITERKEIEVALYEKTERLKAIFDNSPLGIIVLNNEGKIIEVNKFFSTMLQFSKEELLTMYLKDISYNYDNSSGQDSFENLINKKINRYHLEKRYKRKDDTYLDVKVTASSLVDNRSNVFALAIVEDITDLLKAQRQLKDHEEMLHHQSKMAAMGEMLENIAHQWRQPLSVITTGASSIKVQKEFNHLDDEFLITSVDAITKSAQHLSQTIDDFRDFFKPDKEKNEFYIKDIYLKTLSLLSSKFKNREIEIVDNIENVKILAYENELIQVFMNIFNNAQDALEESTQIDKFIFIDIVKEEKYVTIKIRDNASGINDEIIKKVFEPYFTTKHQSQGTGIGLYMSEEIIVKHLGGEISVENVTYQYNNQAYRGAEFKIKIPC